MKKLTLLLGIMLVLACSSDDAVDPESLLPPITTTGENTFGCLIDGKFFRPRDGELTLNGGDGKGLRIVSTESNNIEYHIRDYKSEKASQLYIHIEDFMYNSKNTYQLAESNGFRGIDGNNNSYAHCTLWDYDAQAYKKYVTYSNSGDIEISNSIEPLVKNYHHGLFDLKLINIINPNDTITIQLGRFDLEAFSLDRKSWD